MRCAPLPKKGRPLLFIRRRISGRIIRRFAPLRMLPLLIPCAMKSPHLPLPQPIKRRRFAAARAPRFMWTGRSLPTRPFPPGSSARSCATGCMPRCARVRRRRALPMLPIFPQRKAGTDFFRKERRKNGNLYQPSLGALPLLRCDFGFRCGRGRAARHARGAAVRRKRKVCGAVECPGAILYGIKNRHRFWNRSGADLCYSAYFVFMRARSLPIGFAKTKRNRILETT